ncbi:hypothetical protein COLO4_23705 [Corchorus olitorius]|uniref:Rhomboid-like protein 19 n=1 Tax=Corchorus olitorius TaxID=93759 RepID=A0A1R3IF35_9ROSI|nr:hypothetical protein COLO4_23705 [Corchorus olitorius]
MSSPGGGMFGGFTKLCKGLAVILIGGHIVVQLIPASVTYLALIPARSGLLNGVSISLNLNDYLLIGFRDPVEGWVLHFEGYFDYELCTCCPIMVWSFSAHEKACPCNIMSLSVVNIGFRHVGIPHFMTIPFGWNLITAGYIEQTVHGVVVSTLGLLFMGKLLEPIWGSKEFLKFIFIINILTSVCVFITAIALYYITRLETYLYMPLSGFHGVLAGFLVGIKQIVPDQELSLLKIKAKWLPSLMLLFSIAISFFTQESATYLPTLIFGTYTGWIYLRYLQRKPEAKLRGDPNEDFAFSTFFPEFLRPVIDPIASIFHRMLCGKSEASTDAQGYTLGGAPLPGSDPIEATRRRERGARALEERLAAERLAAARDSDESHRDGADNV